MDKVNHACLFPFPAQLYPSDKKLVIVNTSNVRAVELRVSNVGTNENVEYNLLYVCSNENSE